MDNHVRECIRAYYDFWFGLNRIYMEWAKNYDLTVYELFTLDTIHENKGVCTQKMICDALMLSKQTINTILNTFEKKGYIKRMPSKEDKRSKTVVFTPEGGEWAQTILQQMYRFEENAMQRMGKKQREYMKEGNHAFLNTMRTIMKEENGG